MSTREQHIIAKKMWVPLILSILSSHNNFGDEDIRVRSRRDPRDDVRDLKVKALNFCDNLNLESYLNWVQYMKRIFELKRHNDKKSFKSIIVKTRGYAML